MEHTVPASEARDKFAELLDQVEQGRIVVTKHGQEKAFLISVRELRALEETLAVLEDESMMQGLFKSLAELREGQTRPAREAFAELDAEFRDKE